MQTLMNRMSKPIVLMTLGLAFTAPAHAFDPEPIIKRYTALALDQGQVFTYGTVKEANAEGDGFTLTDAIWNLPGMAPIKAETLVFDDVKEEPSTALRIGSLKAEKLESISIGTRVLFDSASLENLVLPAVGETDPLKKLAWYTRFAAEAGTVLFDDKKVASIKNLSVDSSELQTSQPIKMSTYLKGIDVDTTSIPDPGFKKILADLGYGHQFSGEISMVADWDLTSGVMNISTYDMTVKDVGTLSMPFSAGGLTSDTMRELQSTAKTLEGKSAAEVDLAYQEIFKKLYPLSFSVSFKDDSVTERALKMASVQTGQTPEQLVAGAPLMVSLSMGQLNVPEFSAMVSDAVGKFLRTKGTITIQSKPKQPFDPNAYISASSNPPALIDLLQLKVEAE